MYSRSQGREQNRSDYDESDFQDDISDEEYELYRYNLPPKYDGSRFRRRNRRNTERVYRTEPEAEVTVSESDEVSECETLESEADDVKCERLPAEAKPEHIGNGIDNLLARFGDRLGYEEIVIIALILIIAGEGKADGDIILLLALLLLEH